MFSTFRIIIIILAYLAGLALRYLGFGRYGFRFRYRSPYYGLNAYEDDYLINKIRTSIRRRGALKRCRRFLQRKGKTIIIKNTNVMLVYDNKKKTLVCLNAKNLKQSISVEASSQKEARYVFTSDQNEHFEMTFDNICSSFDENSTYRGVSNVLKANFDSVVETYLEQSKELDIIKVEDKPIKKGELLNLNEASEEELAKLPGINIATAKKIVKRINTKGNFLSIEQMCQEMKVKEHFRIQLYNYLCVRMVKKATKVKNNTDRIIDF